MKNNLQVITSLVNLQSRQIDDLAVRAQFDETRNRIYSIASIHELLYQSESFAAIDLATYARQLSSDLLSFYSLQGDVRIEVEGEDVTIELKRAVPYGLLMNELVSNALKHAFLKTRHGVVRIEISRAHSQIHLRIQDDGIGIPASFDPESASSLGIRLIHALASQLGGTIAYLRQSGTTVDVYFPAQVEQESEQAPAEVEA